MKVEISNWLGVAEQQLDLVPGTVTAILGKNATGKTSIATAVATVLTRNVNPYKVPATRLKVYIRDGAERGSVVLTEDNGDPLVAWDLLAGDLTVAAAAPTPLSPASVGLVDFMSLTGKSAVELWEGLFLPPAASLIGQVKQELEGRVPPEDLAGVLKTLAQRGWESLDTVYQDRARRAKQSWQKVTGLDYGVKVAADWLPDGWAAYLDGRTEEDCVNRLSEAQDALTGMHVAHALTSVDIQRAKNAREEIPHHERRVAACNARVEEWGAKGKDLYERTNDAILKSEADRKAIDKERTKRPRKESTLYCPACKQELSYSGTHLATYHGLTADEVASKTDAWEKKIAEMEKRHEPLQKEAADLRLEYGAILSEHSQAKEELSAAKALHGHAVGLATDAEAEPQDEGRASAINEANLTIEHIRRERDLIVRRATAWREHESATTYSLIAKLLGPKGVRAKAMETAMGSLDEFLAVVASQTLWPRVKVGKSYELTIGERASLKLCSESEKWRAQAALQIAVARMRRDPVIVLDRADVLDDHGKWMLSIICKKVSGRDNPPAILLCSTCSNYRDEWAGADKIINL